MLVHSGDLHGGHYFALIKPDRETRWLKFDDDRVTPVTDREVLEENYGGEMLNGLVSPMQRNQVRAIKRFTNAYMLVYVRESAIDEVLAPWKDEDTPPHLSKLQLNFCHACTDQVPFRAPFGRGAITDRSQEARTRRTAPISHREGEYRLLSDWSSSSFKSIQVITDETFAQHEGFDLATFDEKNWPPSDLPTFRVLKNETYSTFKARVAQHFNYPENQIRLWVLVNRQNKTVRPDTHIPENEPALSEWLSALFYLWT